LFIPFYKEYCDEDSEETAEDVTSDNTFNPELELIRKEQSEAVWGAYNELDIGTQLMIADNLAFCPECHSIFEMKKDKNGEPVKVRRKKKTYKEIAMLNEMSEEESVRVSLERVYKYIRNNLKS
jgi:hypothetical protein